MPINEKNPLREPFWDQQKGESDIYYSYFILYRDMPYGPTDPNTRMLLVARERSLREAADIAGKHFQGLAKASRMWCWQERIKAYDKARQTQEEIERTRLRMDAIRRFEDRQIRYRDEAAKSYEKLNTMLHEMLTVSLFEVKEVDEVGENGELTGNKVTVKLPTAWNVNTIARVADSITRLATFAAGIDETGLMDQLLSKIDPANLTIEQRRRINNGEEAIKVILGGSSVAITEPGTGI